MSETKQLVDLPSSIDVEERELPNRWGRERLGDIADVGWGDLQTTKKSYVSEGFLAYSASGPDGRLPYHDYDQEGVVLSAIGALCGKTWLATGKWSCIKNTMRILPTDDAVDIRFLSQQLSDPAIWPKRGTGQPFIAQKDAREIPVLVPPLDEQERIVEILEDQLSRLDTALQSVQTVRKKAAQFRRSLLHAAFTGALTGHDIEEGELPEGWESNTLNYFCEMYQPKTISRKELVDDGPYPVFGANGQIGFYTDFNHEESEVTVTCRGATCGTVNVIPAMSWITGNAMVVRPKEQSLGKEYLNYFLQSSDFTSVISGTAQPQITRKTLSTLETVIAPRAEQERIVEILEDQLSRLDASLAVADAVEGRSAALRRSLLHSAFTGRLTEEWRAAVNV